MTVKPANGSLIIAPPGMIDGRFARTVNLITNHNQEGTFALCVNRPTPHTLEDLAKELRLDLQNLRFPLYWGGPIQKGSIWMLHTPEWENEHTMYVNQHWRVTSHESMFHCLADGDAPRWFRICYGLSQWAPGQLKMELDGQPPFTRSSSWLIADNTKPAKIFDIDPSELWDHSISISAKQSVNNWLA